MLLPNQFDSAGISTSSSIFNAEKSIPSSAEAAPMPPIDRVQEPGLLSKKYHKQDR
jgi:hypothetical protein